MESHSPSDVDDVRSQAARNQWPRGFCGILAVLFIGPLLSVRCRLAGPVSQVAEVGVEETFGYSVEGRPIVGRILGGGPRCAFLFGVIHGNEPLGGPLLDRFIELLQSRPALMAGWQLVVVPVANPDGLRYGTRRNANGVDLNRNFPASNFAASSRHGPHPESEPETQAIVRIIRQFRPERILSVHSPLDCVNWDGPAEDLALAFASQSGYRLQASIGYPTPGSLGSYAGRDLSIPTITLELPSRTTLEGAWARLESALTGFLAPS